MRSLKKIGKWLLYIVAFFVLLFAGFFVYLLIVTKTDPPVVKSTPVTELNETTGTEGKTVIGNNWIRKNQFGLYEMYVEGEPYERGVANGKLSAKLVQLQEDYFVDQIKKMIPSTSYLKFLRYVVGWFNRDLDKNITPEYKQEIYGISQSASANYDFIGTNYQRILNYHAAHDIGHALQNLALVGCTSFATWNAASSDSSLIIGRNFDFYVGDDFARDKIVLFENPTDGYKFMSVTWGGFIGVVSGMNEKGLTVTINAAKSTIPSGSATPVSLVAREILQYASNINEAIAIAHKRTMFVSESFLIGSAIDKKAVIVEKTPDTLDVYDPHSDHILCSNHFQGPELVSSPSNVEQMKESASVYRYKRLQQLLERNKTNSVEKTVAILRDRKGLDDADIGLGNEKALNQFIAHHAIVFEPEKKLVWVSSNPWQLGAFVCYDLNKLFNLDGKQNNGSVTDSVFNIGADQFLQTEAFAGFEKYQLMKQELQEGEAVDLEAFIQTNPSFYHTYVIAGDACFKRGDFPTAKKYYEQALTKEIATVWEERYIKEQLEKINHPKK